MRTPPWFNRALFVALAVAVLLTTLFVHWVRGLTSNPEESAAPAPGSTTVTKSASPENSTRPSRSPSPSSKPSDGLPRDANGFVRSGQKSTGRFTTAKLSLKPAKPGRVVHRYSVRVEDGIGVDPLEAARQVHSVLDDERGWRGMTSGPAKGTSFELVGPGEKTNFTITIAAPPTVDRQCPLNTRGLWSCDVGANVLLNSDRWLYMTPLYGDLEAYRAYMVNHEVGHYLGLGHQTCAGKGPAPVMMQQSKGLQGCTANPWPTIK